MQEAAMNWLSRIRRTFASSRKPVPVRDSAGEPDARTDPPARSGPNSTFGYGALVIGHAHAPGHRPH
jgi:hypothetical protein